MQEQTMERKRAPGTREFDGLYADNKSESYEITRDVYDRLGTLRDDVDNERLIKTARQTYSFENTMYGTLGPERTAWDEEANEAMQKAVQKQQNKGRKKG